MPTRVERLKKRSIKVADKAVKKIKKIGEFPSRTNRSGKVSTKAFKKGGKIERKIIKTKARVAKRAVKKDARVTKRAVKKDARVTKRAVKKLAKKGTPRGMERTRKAFIKKSNKVNKDFPGFTKEKYKPLKKR